MLLDVRAIEKRYGGVHAVSGVTFGVAPGERVALIGPNGAGKSTCFNVIGGQVRPDGGEVRLDGIGITGMPPRELFRRRVGRTFQITATFASMTVRENVQMALLSHHGQLDNGWRRAADQHVATADALLERVGMKAQADRPCSVLAYGDLKRLELSVALALLPTMPGLAHQHTAGL